MPEDLSQRAQGLVDSAAERGLVLRLIGSVAIRHHCVASALVLNQLGREVPMDVDLVGFVRQYRETDALFKSLRYEAESARTLGHEYGIQRLIYYAPDDHTKVEIFLDMLRMSHTLDFRERLDVDSPTLGVAELLLTKLQIFKITEKDIKDIAALLAAHELGGRQREEIDVAYLLSLLRQDWGLYATAKQNLALVRVMIDRYETLDQHARAAALTRLTKLDERIEAEPKSFRWRARAAIGARVPWHQEVGDVER